MGDSGAKTLISVPTASMAGPAPGMSLAGRGVTLLDIARGYLQAHPDRAEAPLISSMVFLCEVLAVELADVDRAVREFRRSKRPQKERAEQILASVPGAHIARRTGPARKLLYPPHVTGVGENRDKPLAASTIRTYRSRILSVLDWVDGVNPRRPYRSRVVTPEWIRVVDEAKKIGRQRAATHVGRLAIYCESLGVAPGDVNSALSKSFFAYLRDRSGIKNWQTYYYCLCKHWTVLCAAGVVHPVKFYRRGPKHSPYSLRPDEAPDHLREPFDRFVRLATSKRRGDRPTTKRLRPATVQMYRSAYFGLLGVLRLEGVDLESLTVRDLLSGPTYVEMLWAFWMVRTGGKPRTWHPSSLMRLRRFARDFVASRYGSVDTGWLDAQIQRLGKPLRIWEHRDITASDLDKMQALLESRLKDRMESGASIRLQMVAARDLVALILLRDRANRGFDFHNAKLVGELPDAPGRDAEDRSYISKQPPYLWRVRTKNRVDTIRFPAAAHDAMALYVALRNELGVSADAFLVTRHLVAMSEGGLYSRMTYLAKCVGIHVTPHDFRRRFVTDELERGTDLDTIKLMFGDSTSQVIFDHYDIFKSEEASRVWNGVVDAYLDDDPGALPLWARDLMRRASEDPDVLRGLTQALGDLDAQRPE